MLEKLFQPSRRGGWSQPKVVSMRKEKPITKWLAICLALLGLCPSFGLLAQQRTTGGAGRTTGGGSFSGSGNTGANRQYTPNGEVGEAMISVDPETRRLIVITDDETSQWVGQVITNLDRPKPQVLIKVVFLEVTHNNSLDIGVEGGYTHNLNNSTTGIVANAFGLSALNSALGTNSAVNVFGQPVQSFSPTPPGAGLYQVLGTDFQATLRAIAQAGRTEVLSRPSILARNNQQATITVGQSVPLVTSVSYNGLNGTPVSAITYQDVGIILRVTPFITSDGLVEMIVSPQISQLSEQSVTVAAGVTAPVIDLRSADTVVVTPNGQTVIIGGLMQNQKTQSDSKIPFLGDIPLLGNLFKHKVKTTTKTELLIFLTPHIVREPSELASLSASERGKAQMPQKAFSEEELNRFLDDLPAKEKESPGKTRK
jgi:general secretion pathway protein D